MPPAHALNRLQAAINSLGTDQNKNITADWERPGPESTPVNPNAARFERAQALVPALGR
jgi:hypothetical protein